MQKRRYRMSLLLVRQNCFNSLPRQLFCTRTSRIIGSFAPYSSTRPGPGSKKPILQLVLGPGSKKTILQIVLVQNSLRGKELKQFCPLRIRDDLCLLFCIKHSSFEPPHKNRACHGWRSCHGIYLV